MKDINYENYLIDEIKQLKEELTLCKDIMKKQLKLIQELKHEIN